MRRLYFRIYLAVLGSLALFAVLAGSAAWLFRELHETGGDPRPHFEFAADIAEHLLPASHDNAALAEELKFWRERTGFDLALLSPDGSILAHAGPIPADAVEVFAKRHGRRTVRHSWHGAFGVTLGDGRQLIAIHPGPANFWPWRLRWLGLMLAIGFAVGVCAYPVVRQLTRNLERLQEGVAAFGQGHLSTRIPVRGRDEVAKLTETFNASAERIEALLRAHKTLLANASHELRSPLARLRMAAESVGAAAPASARAEIGQNIAELDSLVGDILLASRLDAGQETGRPKETLDLVGLLAEECAPFNADLSVESSSSVLIEGDARLIRQLFRNLLENARRYGGPELIEVTVRSDGETAVAAVCDKGPGIPEAERERIFEPFYRPKGRREIDGGAGLGLALVRQIAGRHGGEVRCLPRIGGGTCFRVALPLRQPA